MRARIGIAAIAALITTGVAEAQKPGKFGVGVSIGQPLAIDLSAGELRPQVSFSFPMILTAAFRLEPELGYFSFDDSNEFEETEFSSITFGVGGYYLMNRRDNFLMYVGPRLGVHRFSESIKSIGDPEESFTRTDIFFGVGLGGEHFFSPHLSLGAEARLTYTSRGETDREPSDGPSTKEDGSSKATEGRLFVRFYF